MSNKLMTEPRASQKGKTRWTLTCSLIVGLLVLIAVLCAVTLVAGVIGLGRLAESLPTPPPRPILIVGEIYWTSAMRFLGEDWIWTPLYSIPGGEVTYDSLKDATPVLLIGIQDEWCYVEAMNDWGREVEGWLLCRSLLNYQPTPIPTPNLTPKRP